MNKKVLSLCMLLCGFMATLGMSAEEKTASKEELLKKAVQIRDQRMQWWREAKFGMFIHWGVYSRLGGVWEGKPVTGYAEHIMRISKISVETYRKEVVGKFNPVEFNADEWAKICRDAGMKYMVITSKHHDGFAMFDSKASDYNIVDATPFARDPMRELKAACGRQGIKFGFYYSHAQDWNHQYGQRNTWDYDQPASQKWWLEDKWIQKDYLNKSKIYVREKSIPQLLEIIDQYDPAIVWFDTPGWLPDELNTEIVQAGRIRNMHTIFNSRSAPGLADYQSTCDKPDHFPPQEGDWEAIPTTNESYGYHSMDLSYKPSSFFIRLLARACARGGNLLMNIGPMGNGKIDPKDVAILEGIGDWLKVNGDSIYGTVRTTLPVQAWGESTIKGKTVYLHVLEWPTDGKLIVGGLKSDIQRAYFLADSGKSPITVMRLNPLDVKIGVPLIAPDSVDTVIALECKDEILGDPDRLLVRNVKKDMLHVFDGQLHGSGIKYGRGNAKENAIMTWSNPDSYVSWQVRVDAPTTFGVGILYDNISTQSAYTVNFGDQLLNGVVKPNAKFQEISLGKVILKPGRYTLKVVPDKIEKENLMNLRGLVLTPVND